jgi:pentatricopeptide repeat protein
MHDKTLDQVPAACANLYQCGLAALEKSDAASAIASLITALEMEPGFVACREALRRAQKMAVKKKPGLWKRIFRKGPFSPSLGEAEVLLHLQPLKTISLAERVLNQDPGNMTAHKLLAKAALAADLPQTALLSLEELAGGHSDHRAIKLEVAEALERSGDVSSATAIYGQLLKDNPEDGTVLRALQNVAARHVAQQTHAVVAEPVPAVLADDVISRFEPLLVRCPRNAKVITTLAEAYARKGMFDKALSLYQHALQIEKGKNPDIKRAVAETAQKKYDSELSQLDPKSPDYAARREQIENRRLEFQWHEMEETH